MSHADSVHLTGMAVETTCTVDMKQQHSCSNCDEAGKAPVVSLSFPDHIKYGGGGGNYPGKLILLGQQPFLIAFKSKTGSFVIFLMKT